MQSQKMEIDFACQEELLPNEFFVTAYTSQETRDRRGGIHIMMSNFHDEQFRLSEPDLIWLGVILQDFYRILIVLNPDDLRIITPPMFEYLIESLMKSIHHSGFHLLNRDVVMREERDDDIPVGLQI